MATSLVLELNFGALYDAKIAAALTHFATSTRGKPCATQMARRARGAEKTAVVLKILRTPGSRKSRHLLRISLGGITSLGMPRAVNPSDNPAAKAIRPPTSRPPVIRTFSGVVISVLWKRLRVRNAGSETCAPLSRAIARQALQTSDASLDAQRLQNDRGF